MTARIIYANNKLIKVSGVGYAPIGEFYRENEEPFRPIEDKHFELLFRIGVLNGTSKVEKKENLWITIGDPTEGSLHTLAMKAGVNIKLLKEKYPQIGEIPFTSESKRMVTIHKTPENETQVYIKGALDIILDRCNLIYINGNIQPIIEEERTKILKLNEVYSSQQLRILG
ncbi:MAG: hypothetical protein HWN66_21405, partial [Candidatus Helarchaeota archaeon]|nr:hypothetical protein [Candidatus Helarchaeota archaeon]